MINKQRVQRIKNLIYAFIILIMFLPLILMSILSFQMFGAIKDLNAKVEGLSKIAISQSAAANTPPSGENTVEPEGQTSKNAEADTQNPGETAPDDVIEPDSLAMNNENLDASPDNDSSVPDIGGESGILPDEGSELGGGAPLEKTDDEFLAVTDTGEGANNSSGSSSAQGELAGNPQMGFDDETPSADHTINPSTGA